MSCTSPGLPGSGCGDLTSRRSFQSYSPRNVSPGDIINMDAVTERYRKQHLEEEEKKARKAAAQLEAQKE